jgi:hypothetical protein
LLWATAFRQRRGINGVDGAPTSPVVTMASGAIMAGGAGQGRWPIGRMRKAMIVNAGARRRAGVCRSERGY